MNIKNLFKNALAKAQVFANESEQNAKDYTDTLGTNIVTVSLSGTYITGGELKYVKVGNLVVFAAYFTPRQNITSSVGQCYTSSQIPQPIYSSSGLFAVTSGPGDTTTPDTTRRTTVAGIGLYPLGQYAQGTSYYVCGAYLCVGGVTKLLTYLSSLFNRKAVMA